MGMDVELEHGTHDPETNVTDDDLLTTAKIARAHLNEFPDYYSRLSVMEAEAKAHWASREASNCLVTRIDLLIPSPATRDHLLAGVEVDGVGAVGVEVAVHRVLPAGEGEPGDRGGDADVDAEHPGLGAVAVAAGGLAR